MLASFQPDHVLYENHLTNSVKLCKDISMLLPKRWNTIVLREAVGNGVLQMKGHETRHCSFQNVFAVSLPLFLALVFCNLSTMSL